MMSRCSRSLWVRVRLPILREGDRVEFVEERKRARCLGVCYQIGDRGRCYSPTEEVMGGWRRMVEEISFLYEEPRPEHVAFIWEEDFQRLKGGQP